MNTGRVLLVCDGIQEFLFYRGILSDLGYVFVICGCYEEGARRVATEDFDFAIVSQGGESFEGRCVLERAAELHRDIPIIIVTHCLDTHCYLEAMELGAVDYLERPGPSDLGWVLETELRRRAAV